VGWFVIVATVLLLAGFGYYVYHTAEHKGWFLTKVRYHTFVRSAAGLHVGDPVKLMGFDVGQITKIEAMPPFSTWGNVYIEFILREPYYGYIWTDSEVKLISAGFLGNRALELLQGGTSGSTNLHASYEVDDRGKVLGVWNWDSSNYVAYTPKSKGFGFSRADEPPQVTERLEKLADQVEKALPGILNLTNDLARVLTNAAQLTAHADSLVTQAQPIITNVALIAATLTNGPGSLGDWFLPTNVNQQLQLTLASANATLNTANSNVVVLSSNLNLTLQNVANITSNLNTQVQTNDQLLTRISTTIVNADQFVQGLKHHWLLRSAFKHADTNAAPARSRQPSVREPPAEPKTGKRLP
jgi:ABC-type transporter Mla subunit MlaD